MRGLSGSQHMMLSVGGEKAVVPTLRTRVDRNMSSAMRRVRESKWNLGFIGVACLTAGSKRLKRDRVAPAERSPANRQHTAYGALLVECSFLPSLLPLTSPRQARSTICPSLRCIVALSCRTASRSAVPRHSTSERPSALPSPPRRSKSASLGRRPSAHHRPTVYVLASQAATPIFHTPGRASVDPGDRYISVYEYTKPWNRSSVHCSPRAPSV